MPPARFSPLLPSLPTWLLMASALMATAGHTATLAGPAAPLAGQAAPDASGCSVLWHLQPQWQASPAHLQVSLRFAGGGRQRTLLHLPGGWAGHDAQTDAAGASPRLQDVPGQPAWRSLAHAPGEVVNLHWRVSAGGTANPASPFTLAATWLAFAGGAVLPLPDGLDERSAATACILLSGLPAGGRWASSHGLAEGSSALFKPGGPGVALAPWVQQSLFAGGALQWHSTPGLTTAMPEGADGALAIDQVAQAGERALAAQQLHWGAPAASTLRPGAEPPWLLLVLPAQGYPAQAGQASAWQRALALQMPPTPLLPAAQATAQAGDSSGSPESAAASLDWLLAQALARAWVAERFGPLAHTGRGDAGLRAWFSEGWADYLAHRSLLRQGLWTPDDYARALTRQANRYLTEPARALPNAALASVASVSPARLQALQAARGEWLALHWQQSLRRAGQPGLDMVLRRLLLPAAQARREGPISAPLATHRLVAALRPALQDQPLRDLRQHIEQGQPFNLGPDSLGPCFTGRRLPASATGDGGLMDYQPVPQALQQPACQAWLGTGGETANARMADGDAADGSAADPALRGTASASPPRQRSASATATGKAGKAGKKASQKAGQKAGGKPGAQASKAGARPGKAAKVSAPGGQARPAGKRPAPHR